MEPDETPRLLNVIGRLPLVNARQHQDFGGRSRHSVDRGDWLASLSSRFQNSKPWLPNRLPQETSALAEFL